MLRIATIKQVGPRLAYHKRSNALTPAEKAGLWLGTGCAAVGVAPAQPVAENDLAALLSGYAADTAAYLGQRRDPRRRAGWDVCLSVHKSVSVAGLCGPPELRSAVRSAYDEAVAAFPAALEALACHCTGGRPPVDTGSLIIAAFTHERSRRDDPHLHTHYIVMNATWDGKCWRALEPARFFRCNLDLDRAFQRELLRALRSRKIDARLDGKGRVILPRVPTAACQRLSAAKAAIENALTVPHGVLRSPDTIHRQAAAALINDRLRPKKKPLEEARSFDRMLTAAELRQLLTIRSAPPAPPPAEPDPADIFTAVRRTADLRSPFPTPRNNFAAAIRTASKHLLWPLVACLEAARQLSSLPWARAPWRASLTQRNAAAFQQQQRAAHARSAAAALAAAQRQQQQQQRRRAALLRQQQQQQAAARIRAVVARQRTQAATTAALRQRRALWLAHQQQQQNIAGRSV